jgi:hypothetical protein
MHNSDDLTTLNYNYNYNNNTTNGYITTASHMIAHRISGDALKRMNLEEYEHIMGGEMVKAAVAFTEIDRETMISKMTENGFKDHVKEQLCHVLVHEMMKNNLIEFTMTHDPNDWRYIYRARAYVMPDHMTKILREYVQRNT